MLRMTCRASPENTFLIFIRLQMKIRWDSLQELLCKEPEELHGFGLKAQKWVTEYKNAKVQAHKVVGMLQ